jgi:hypothetical protein
MPRITIGNQAAAAAPVQCRYVTPDLHRLTRINSLGGMHSKTVEKPAGEMSGRQRSRVDVY